MLKADTIAKIKAHGYDVDKLIAAIKEEKEVDYEVPEVITIKQTDLDARDTNKLNEGKRIGETEGEKKGKELAAKAFRKKFNIEDTVGNEVDKVVEAVNTKLNKGDAGLQEQITLLQSDKTSLQTQITELNTKARSASDDMEIISFFPSTRTPDLQDGERLGILKSAITFEMHDGKKVAKRNGEILRDKTTQNPLPINQVITDYFGERKWNTASGGGGGNGGRGGGDNPPPEGGGTGGLKKMSEFKAKWAEENPDKAIVSPEFTTAVSEHAKKTTDFDYYH